MTKPKQHKQKHIPMRTCIATGEQKPKVELLRLVKTEDGKLEVDVTGKLKGRGANILPTLEALEQAFKKRAITRALKLDSPLSKEEENDIRDKFSKAIDEKSFRPNNKPVTIRVKKDSILK